jgi:hypothetical protein
MKIPIDRIRSRKPLEIERASSLNHFLFYHAFAHSEELVRLADQRARDGIPEAGIPVLTSGEHKLAIRAEGDNADHASGLALGVRGKVLSMGRADP